jgi:hypothetical protein
MMLSHSGADGLSGEVQQAEDISNSVTNITDQGDTWGTVPQKVRK